METGRPLGLHLSGLRVEEKLAPFLQLWLWSGGLVTIRREYREHWGRVRANLGSEA
jgi:hypothetical protein